MCLGNILPIPRTMSLMVYGKPMPGLGGTPRDMNLAPVVPLKRLYVGFSTHLVRARI